MWPRQVTVDSSEISTLHTLSHVLLAEEWHCCWLLNMLEKFKLWQAKVLPQFAVRQEKAHNNMTTIGKMSWSLKNKPIKYYSLVTFLVFLFVMTIFQFKDEKRERRTCDNLRKLETLSDIASSVGACDILDRIYSINVYATPIIIPDQLWVKVRSWLQEDEGLLKTATNQNVIHITNKVKTLHKK